MQIVAIRREMGNTKIEPIDVCDGENNRSRVLKNTGAANFGAADSDSVTITRTRPLLTDEGRQVYWR